MSEIKKRKNKPGAGRPALAATERRVSLVVRVRPETLARIIETATSRKESRGAVVDSMFTK